MNNKGRLFFVQPPKKSDGSAWIQTKRQLKGDVWNSESGTDNSVIEEALVLFSGPLNEVGGDMLPPGGNHYSTALPFTCFETRALRFGM